MIKIEAGNRLGVTAAAKEDTKFEVIEVLRKKFGPKAVKFSRDKDDSYSYDIKGRYEGFTVWGFVTVSKKGKIEDGEITLEDRYSEETIALHALNADKKTIGVEIKECEARIRLLNSLLGLVDDM